MLEKKWRDALVSKTIAFAAGNTSGSNKAIVIADTAWSKYQVELNKED